MYETMNQVHPTEAPVAPEIIELNDLSDLGHFVCVQARVQLGEDVYAAYIEASRVAATRREAAVDAYFGGNTQQMAEARQGLAQAQANVDRFNVKIDDAAWAGFAEQQHRAIQQQQFEQVLQAQRDEANQNDTPVSRKAKKAGFTVIPGGKKPEVKKPFTLSDLVPDNAQEKKKSA